MIEQVHFVSFFPTLCDPMDYSPPGSSVSGILQARILEWVAMPFSRESSQPRCQTQAGLLHCRWVIYRLSHQTSPTLLIGMWISFLFPLNFKPKHKFLLEITNFFSSPNCQFPPFNDLAYYLSLILPLKSYLK